MPHIPKSNSPKPRTSRLASTSSPLDPEMPIMRSNAGAVQSDVLQPDEDDAVYRPPTLGLESVSLVRYEVSPHRVFEQLFGEQFEVDKFGRTMVPGLVSKDER